jgi:hypothetical protein
MRRDQKIGRLPQGMTLWQGFGIGHVHGSPNSFMQCLEQRFRLDDELQMNCTSLPNPSSSASSTDVSTPTRTLIYFVLRNRSFRIFAAVGPRNAPGNLLTLPLFIL